MFSMGEFGLYLFVATKEEGDKITDKINKERRASERSALPISCKPLIISTFDTYFARNEQDRITEL